MVNLKIHGVISSVVRYTAKIVQMAQFECFDLLRFSHAYQIHFRQVSEPDQTNSEFPKSQPASEDFLGRYADEFDGCGCEKTCGQQGGCPHGDAAGDDRGGYFGKDDIRNFSGRAIGADEGAHRWSFS